jgi:ubiquinone/menaquinone biosynthesis C-methylase UbiE
MQKEVSELRNHLVQLAELGAKRDWLSELNVRKRNELEFHNKNRDVELTESLPSDTYELLHGNKKYYTTTARSRDYVDQWLAKQVKGRVFLDYACGNGTRAIQAAQMGAVLAIGLDISDVSVANARKAAEQAGVSDRCIFLQADCENTGLPANGVDVILCSGMLHHLDLSYALPELRRILKPGGVILAVEALNYNPIIKIYRWLTPSMRTDWEKRHILSFKDIRFATRFFTVKDIRFWHAFSIFGAFFPAGSGIRSLFGRVFDGLDQVITRIPLARLMAWQFTFVMEKQKDG